MSSGSEEDSVARLALSSQVGCRNENDIGGASVGSVSTFRNGAVTLTWIECVGSSDTCRAKWISEGSG